MRERCIPIGRAGVAAVLLASIGCGPNPQLVRLEGQVESLQQQVTALAEAQAQAQQQLAELRGALPADLEPRLSALERDLQDLAARDLETRERADQVGRKVDDVGFKLDALGVELRALQLVIDRLQFNPTAPPGTGLEESTAGADSRKPEEIYATGYSEFQRGNYHEAVREFRTFLLRHPQAELAEYAQYWIGECLMAQRRYEEAIAEFGQVIHRFPQGDKAPAAYLKQGLAYVELNQIAQGVVQLQRLIEQFPRSREAQLARERLEDLGLRGGVN
jgi:tol-pal system protein YbgF